MGLSKPAARPNLDTAMLTVLSYGCASPADLEPRSRLGETHNFIAGQNQEQRYLVVLLRCFNRQTAEYLSWPA